MNVLPIYVSSKFQLLTAVIVIIMHSVRVYQSITRAEYIN